MDQRDTKARQCSETDRNLLLSILITKYTKKSPKTRGENWKYLWDLRKTSRKCLRSRKLHPRRHPQRFLNVQWNLINPQDNDWNLVMLKIMKTTLRAKDSLRCHTAIWCASLLLCHKRWRFPMQKLQWIKNGINSRQFQHDTWEKSRATRRLFWKHKEPKVMSILQHWCTYVTSRMRNWNPKLQMYKGRVVLRGDIVKDDSGAHAVFTEQGSPASQMSAANIMDVIARLPSCEGQAADAVSAYTQVKLLDAPDCSQFQSQNVQTCRYVFHDIKWPNSWTNVEGTFWTKFIWSSVSRDCSEKDNSKKLLDGRKYQIGECMFVHWKQELFLSVFADDIKMTGKKQNKAPMWKKLMKNVDLEESTTILDHVYLGCTQRECKPNETIVEQHTKVFESRISAGATEKFPGWKSCTRKL